MTEAVYPQVCPPDPALARLLAPVRPAPGTVCVPSCFVLPFEHRGKRYAFHTLTRQCIEAELPPSAAAGEGADGLIAARFLVPQHTDESASYQALSLMMRAYTRKKGLRSYTILPTLGCNARCVYCYQEGMAQTAMSPETVEQVVRFILETHGQNRVNLDWFGGEPLLRQDVIDRVCRALRENGREYSSTMISNGSLITPDVVERMAGDWRLRSIQISMDGAEEDYIARKRYVSGGGQYRRVMEAVSAMSGAGIRVAVRCNVDGQNWDGIPCFLEELGGSVSHRENVSVYFCPLNSVRMSGGDLAVWEKIRDVRPLVRAAGFSPVSMMGPDPRFRVTHCMADSAGVVIAPDGALYACEHCTPESRLGDVRRGADSRAPGVNFCRTDRIREKCRRCPFLPDCTSFSACPVEDVHCREVREMMMLDGLRRLIDGTDRPGNGAENLPNC